MPGLNTTIPIASKLLKLDQFRHHRPVLVGEGRVELHAPATKFRQPKGKKHAPKELTEREAQARDWKASKHPKRRVCGCGICRHPDLWVDAPSRSEARRRAIEEERQHAAELNDLEACNEDGHEGTKELKHGSYTTDPAPTRPKEAHMNRTKNRKSSPDRSIVTVRTGGSRARMPWRTDCTIEPSLTMAPDPEAKAISADDARLLAKRPVDPATRKAEPVLPEGVWSLDDLIEDRKMVRLGC